jgi:RHS repeat-associated protein
MSQATLRWNRRNNCAAIRAAVALVSAVIVLGSVAPPVIAQDVTWQTVASDGFTTALKPPRTAGTPINGLTTESGGLAWSATTALVLPQYGPVGKGMLTNTSSTVKAQRGSVPYVASAQFPATLHKVSMQADFATYSPAEDAFVAVAFFNAPNRPVWNGGELWMVVRPSGWVKVTCPAGDLYTSSVTPDPAFSSGLNHLELQYDSATGEVQARLNDVQLVLTQPNVHALGHVPNVLHAGFNAYRAAAWPKAGELKMDDFLLEKGTPVLDPNLSIEVVPDLTYQLIDDRVTYTCDADGAYQPLNYQWQKVLREMPWGGPIWTELTNGGGISGTQTSQLVFDPLAANHEISIRCQVTDSAPDPNTIASARMNLKPQDMLAFSNFDGERGTLLDGSLVDGGSHPDASSLAWDATLALIHEGHGFITSNQTGSGAHAGLAVASEDFLDHATFTVEADVVPIYGGTVLIGFLDDGFTNLRTGGILTMSLHAVGDEKAPDAHITVQLQDGTTLFEDTLAKRLEGYGPFRLKLMYDRTGGLHRAWFDQRELDLADPPVIGPEAAQHFDGVGFQVESDTEWRSQRDVNIDFFAVATADLVTDLRIVNQPEDVTVQRGFPATFTCEAAGGVPEYSYRWQRGVYSPSSQTLVFPSDPADGIIDADDANFTGQTTNTLTVVQTSGDSEGGYRCIVTDADSGHRSVESDGARLVVNNDADDGCAPIEPRVETFDGDTVWTPYCFENFNTVMGRMYFKGTLNPVLIECPDVRPYGSQTGWAVRENVPIPVNANIIRVEFISIWDDFGPYNDELNFFIAWGDEPDQRTPLTHATGQDLIIDIDVSDLDLAPDPGEDDGFIYRDLTFVSSTFYAAAYVDSIDVLSGPRPELYEAYEFSTYTSLSGGWVNPPEVPTPEGDAIVLHPGRDLGLIANFENVGCEGPVAPHVFEFTLCDVGDGECHNEAFDCAGSALEQNEYSFSSSAPLVHGQIVERPNACIITPPDLPDGTLLRLRGQLREDVGSRQVDRLMVIRHDPVTDLEIDQNDRLEATAQRWTLVDEKAGDWDWVDTELKSLSYGDRFSITTSAFARYTPSDVAVPVYVYGYLNLPGQASGEWRELGHTYAEIEQHTNITIDDLTLENLEFPEGMSWALLDLLVVVDPPWPNDPNRPIGDSYGLLDEWGSEYTGNYLFIDDWMVVAATEEPGDTLIDFHGRHTYEGGSGEALSFAGQTSGWYSTVYPNGIIHLKDDSNGTGPNLIWYDLTSILPEPGPYDDTHFEITGVMVRYRREGNHNGNFARLGTGPIGYTGGDTSFTSTQPWLDSEFELKGHADGQWRVAMWKHPTDGPFKDLNLPVLAAGAVPGAKTANGYDFNTLTFELDHTTNNGYPKATWFDEIWVFVSEITGPDSVPLDFEVGECVISADVGVAPELRTWHPLTGAWPEGVPFMLGVVVDSVDDVSESILPYLNEYTIQDPDGPRIAPRLGVQSTAPSSKSTSSVIYEFIPPQSGSRSTGSWSLGPDDIGMTVEVLGGTEPVHCTLAHAKNYNNYDTDASTANHPSGLAGSQLPPDGLVSSGSIDSIDPRNGNLNVTIPIYTLHADAGLSYNVALNYNSKIWSYHNVFRSSQQCQFDEAVVPLTTAAGISGAGVGWEFRPPRLVATREFVDNPDNADDFVAFGWFVDERGHRHKLYDRPRDESQDAQDCTVQSSYFSCYTLDGSNLSVDFDPNGQNAKGYGPEGTVYHFRHKVMPHERGFLLGGATGNADSVAQPDPCDIEAGMDFREHVAGLYVSRIERGPIANSSPSDPYSEGRAGQLVFSYCADGVSGCLDSDMLWYDPIAMPQLEDGLEPASWLPATIEVRSASDAVRQMVKFVYSTVTLDNPTAFGAATKNVVVLDSIQYPVFSDSSSVSPGGLVDLTIAAHPFHRPDMGSIPAAGAVPFLEEVKFNDKGTSHPANREFRYLFDYANPAGIGNPGQHGVMRGLTLPTDSGTGPTIKYSYGPYRNVLALCDTTSNSQVPDEGGCGPNLFSVILTHQSCENLQDFDSWAAYGVIDREESFTDSEGSARTRRTHLDPQLFCASASPGDTVNFYESESELLWKTDEASASQLMYLWTEVATADGTGAAPTSTVYRYHPLTNRRFSTSTMTYPSGRTLPSPVGTNPGVRPVDPAADPTISAREIHRQEVVQKRNDHFSSTVDWAGFGTGDAFYTARTTGISDSRFAGGDGDESISGCMSSDSCTLTTTLRAVDQYLRPICVSTCSGYVTADGSGWDCVNPAENEPTGFGVSRWNVMRYKEQITPETPFDPFEEHRFDLVEVMASTDANVDPNLRSPRNSGAMCGLPSDTTGWSVRTMNWAESADWWDVESVIDNPAGAVNPTDRQTCASDCRAAVFTRDGLGDLIEVARYGGYEASSEYEGFVSLTDAYRTGFTIGRDPSSGAVTSIESKTWSGGGARPTALTLGKSGFHEITGQVRWSVGGNGVGQGYDYDHLGRVVGSVAIWNNGTAQAEVTNTDSGQETLRCQAVAYCPPGETATECSASHRAQVVRFDGTPTVDTVDDEVVVGCTAVGPKLHMSFVDEMGRPVETRQRYLDNAEAIQVRSRKHNSFISSAGAEHGFTFADSTWALVGGAVNWASVRLDALGRPIEATQPDGSTVTMTHAGNRYSRVTRDVQVNTGRGVESIDTEVFVDAAGRTVRVEEEIESGGSGSDVVASVYEYDHRNRIAGITITSGGAHGAEQVRSWTYSPGGFLTRAREPEINTRVYSYDALGNAIDTSFGTDVNGQASSTNWDYDAYGRLITRNTNTGASVATWLYHGGTPYANRSYGMLASSTQSESATSIDVTQTWAYGAPLGLPSGKTQEIAESSATRSSQTVSFEYDVWGRRSKTMYPNGTEAIQTHVLGGSHLHNLSLELDPRVAGAESVSHFGYLPSGLVGSIGLGDATQTITGDTSGMGRVAQRTIAGDGGSVVLSEAFDYDPSGNIASVVQSQKATGGLTAYTKRFAYDGLNRLVEQQNDYESVAKAGTESYSYDYDIWGNLKSIARPRLDSHPTIQVDPATNRCTTCGDYDNQGNLTGLVPGSNTRTYSGENRLLTATRGMTTFTFAYDTDGERVAMLDSSGTQTYFVRDLNGRILWEDGTTGQVAYYYANGKRIAQRRGGALQFIGTGQFETTRVLFDDQGQVVSGHEFEFAPFGKLTGDPPQSPQTDQLFTGHERDFDLELDYMHQRYYSAEFGRFVSVDPIGGRIGSSQSFNRYSYVNNNPINYWDPFGLTEDGGGERDKDEDEDEDEESTPDDDDWPVFTDEVIVTDTPLPVFGGGSGGSGRSFGWRLPSLSDTYFISLDGQMAGGMALAGEAGIYVNPIYQNGIGDFGLFGNAGIGGGEAFGLSATAGWVFGDASTMDDPFWETNIDMGWWAVTVMVDPSTNNIVGVTTGPGGSVGLSTTYRVQVYQSIGYPAVNWMVGAQNHILRRYTTPMFPHPYP